MGFLNELSYSNKVCSPTPIRFTQTHKQNSQLKLNVAGYIRNPVAW